MVIQYFGFYKNSKTNVENNRIGNGKQDRTVFYLNSIEM